jgi:hypothetical protein
VTQLCLAEVETNKPLATTTLQAPQRTRALGTPLPRATGSSTPDAVAEESPFVPDKARRPGLAPGQWDPAQGGAVQAEAAKQSYLEGMYYCIGTVPRNGLRTDTVYDAYVMGTRVAYWKSAVPCS